MKNKKGFTLIELLAVIVVLAIIALIAKPIVMNTIKNAKKEAAERTADNYIKQVETAVAESRIDGTKIANGTYNIQPDGNLCPASGCGENDKDKITIDMSGNKPTSGTVKILNGGVSQDGTTMTVGNYNVKYNQENKKYEAAEIYKGVLCKAVTTATTGNVPQGKFAYGDEYTCELGDNDTKTFFVLETSDNNVSLIMNANVDSNGKALTPSNIPTDKGTAAWIIDEDWKAAGGVITNEMKNDGGACQYAGYCATNEYGPVSAEKKLKINTKGWIKLSPAQITLPTAYQIATASEKTFNNRQVVEIKTWLKDYLRGATNNVSDVNGYWTSSPKNSSVNSAWRVVYSEGINDHEVYVPYGIRPVITISKSQLG